MPGQNLQTEVRWSAGDPTRTEAYATDLVGLFKPDLLLSVSTGNLVALQRATKTIPIVFMAVADPVEQGLVPNLAYPGGNITGFANPEFSIAGKWAEPPWANITSRNRFEGTSKNSDLREFVRV